MPEPVDIGYSFRLPPRRAIEYFRSKGYEISWNWWETWEAAHARSFTVAKAARLDILSDIRSEVQRALDDGITAREFAAALEPRLKAKGWWGRQVVVDPKGGADLVTLGTPRRLKTIYRTNMRVARAVARQQAQREVADIRHYWMYISMDDDRVRAAHAALHGLVFRHDDPFWDTHYPPNDWGCRCRVAALTPEEVEARGLTVSGGGGKLHAVEQRVGLDKRTGEIVTRPATRYRDGDIAMTPGPGWNYNPGASGGDPGNLPPLVVPPPARGQKGWLEAGLPASLPPSAVSPISLPAAGSGEAQRIALIEGLGYRGASPTAFTRRDGKRDAYYYAVAAPGDLGETLMSASVIDKVMLKPKDARERWVNFVVPTLRDPGEVWLQEQVRDDRTIYRRVFLAAYPDSDMLVLAQEEKEGWLLWNYYSLRENELNTRRVGKLLYRNDTGRSFED